MYSKSARFPQRVGLTLILSRSCDLQLFVNDIRQISSIKSKKNAVFESMVSTAVITGNHAAVTRLETVVSIFDRSLTTAYLTQDGVISSFSRSASLGRKQYGLPCTKRQGQQSQKTLRRHVKGPLIDRNYGTCFTFPRGRLQSQQNEMSKRCRTLDGNITGRRSIYNVAKHSSSKYGVLLPGSTCRYVSTRPMPSPPTRNGPGPPRSVNRPRPPPVPLSGIRPLPGRLSIQREEEVMMPGIRARERDREIMDKKQLARHQARLKKYNQVISEVDDLKTSLYAMRRDAIAEEMEYAIELGKRDYLADYYAQRFHKFNLKLNLNQRRIEAMTYTILDLGGRRAGVLFTQFVQLADSRTDSLQNFLADMDMVVSDLMFKRNNINSYYFHKALEICRIRDRLKLKTNGNHPLWRGIGLLQSTIFEIISYTEITLVPSIPKVDSSTAQKIQKLSDVGKSLGYPLGLPSTHFVDWVVALGEIAHNVRQVELNMEMSQHLPEITFAERWAASEKACYLQPVKEMNYEIAALLNQNIFQKASRRKGQRRNSISDASFSKFHALPMLFDNFIRQTISLTSSFGELIGDGYNNLCPHPDQALLQAQIRVNHPIKASYDGWDDIEKAVLGVRLAIRAIQSDDVAAEKYSLASRTRLLALLNDHVEEPTDMNHPFSRRGRRHDKFNLLVWYSTKWLRDRSNASSGVKPAVFADHATSSTHHYRVLEESESKPSFTPASATVPWIADNFLYPRGPSVMIDFVSSEATLYEVIGELAKQQVVGLEITSTKIPNLHVTFVEYIVMSTHTNVYILDFLALRQYKFILDVLPLLRSVLANPSIVKVGVNTAHLADILWYGAAPLSLTSVYDVAHQQSSQNPPETSEGLTSGIDQYFGPESGLSKDHLRRPSYYRDHDPIKFFHREDLH